MSSPQWQWGVRDHPPFSKHRREAQDPIFQFVFFVRSTPIFFFPTVLMKNYWNLSQRTYFLKASSQSSKSQAQIFTSKFGGFSGHCVNYHEPLCMQKAGVWNVLPIGQRNVFLKTWHLSASIQCETTDTAFSVYKRKKKEKNKPFSVQ